MFAPRSLFKRAVAVVMPFCFLWAFAACVSLCAEDSEETRSAHDGSALSSVVAYDASAADDCCPIVDTPKAAMSDRLSLPHAGNDVAVEPASLARASVGSGISPYSSDDYPYTDPPFERSRVLRI